LENYALTVNFAIMVSIVKFIGFSFLSLSLTIAACCCSVNKDVKDADVFKLEGTTDTLLFKQAPFQWRVTPRYDYSKVYVTKLFLCQSEYDKEYLGAYKMRDNGSQTVYMTCEQALEAIKGMDALTPGLQKIVYLVGWQYNGHDSKYPAFFEGNMGIKREDDEDPLDSVRWLMEEARNYNTAVSLHINLFDAFDDSPLFEKYVKEDVLARDKDGKYILGDWAYKVSYAAEWEKGLVQERLDSLCALLPVQKAGTIHIDAFHNAVPRPRMVDGRPVIRMESPISPWHGHTAEQDKEAKAKIVGYLDSKGIDVTTEGADMYIGDLSDGWFPMYWHFSSREHALSLSASQACGGDTGGQLRAFCNNVNGEEVFRRAPDLSEAFERFKEGFCKTTLITLYLNNFSRKALIRGEGGKAIGVFEDGLRTYLEDGEVDVAKDGNMLAENGNIFMPALWIGNSSVIAFSEKGYSEMTWTVPSGVKISRRAKGWTLEASGRREFKDFKVKGDKVTLSLSPGEMVLITD